MALFLSYRACCLVAIHVGAAGTSGTYRIRCRLAVICRSITRSGIIATAATISIVQKTYLNFYFAAKTV
jgi:hypothetical protein